MTPATPDDLDARTGGSTENFRRQHQDLLVLATEIGGRLSLTRVAAEPGELRRLLAQFAGRLHVHARMENEALYPRLLAHADPLVRTRAAELHREVGTVYEAFDRHLEAWPSAAAIAQAPDAFIRQTSQVFRVLGRRMLREESELYPLVDQADARS